MTTPGNESNTNSSDNNADHSKDNIGDTLKGDMVLSLKGTPEYDNYPYASSSKTFKFMASIKAPYFRSDTERAAIDLVCCVDESGSMRGERIDLVRQTLVHIINNLQSMDRFACVGYSNASRVILPLTEMGKEGKDRALNLVNGIRAKGSTALAAGLFKSIDLIRKRSKSQTTSQSNSIASVMLFTDGEANIGPTTALAIVRWMKNPNWKQAQAALSQSRKYQTYARTHRQTLSAFVRRSIGLPTLLISLLTILLLLMVIHLLNYTSNTLAYAYIGLVLCLCLAYALAYLREIIPVSGIVSRLTTRAATMLSISRKVADSDGSASELPCTINTFGFGSGHKAPLLQAIAENGRGIYAYIKDAEMIASTFAECLGGLVSIVGQNVVVTVEALNDIRITRCLTHGYEVRQLIAQKQIQIAIPDIQSEESRDLMFELNMPSAQKALLEYPIIQLSVQYTNVIKKTAKELLCVVCTIARPDTAEFGERSMNVDIQSNRLAAAEAMLSADKHGQKGQLDKARQTLKAAQQLIRASDSHNNPYCKELVNDMNTCISSLSSQGMYSSTGSKVLTSNSASHYQQRCSSSTTYKSQIQYRSRAKSSMMSKFN